MVYEVLATIKVGGREVEWSITGTCAEIGRAREITRTDRGSAVTLTLAWAAIQEVWPEIPPPGGEGWHYPGRGVLVWTGTHRV